MKTIIYYIGALRLVIMGLFSLFTVNPSMGAKTGVITAPTGGDANLVTLGASQPVRDTLAGVIRTALQLATAMKRVLINIGQRKAVVLPTGASIATVLDDAGMNQLVTFQRQTDGTWDVTKLGVVGTVEDMLEEIISAQKPKLSVESLLNKIEDLSDSSTVVADGDCAGGFLIDFDQADGLIKVHAIDTAPHAVTIHNSSVALSEDVQFVQTLDSGGAQFGE